MPKSIISRWSDACALLLSILSCPVAAAPAEIEFGFPEAPGVIYTDAQGRADGPLYQLTATILNKAGISFHADGYPATRLYNNLRDGHVHLSVLPRSAAIDACCLYSKEAPFISEVGVYYAGDNSGYENKESLIGHSIITIFGYNYGGFVDFIRDKKNKIVEDTSYSHESGFALLKLGRDDYFVDYTINASAYLAEHPIANVHCSVISRIPMYFVLAKTYPDAERTLAQIDAVYKTVGKDKTLLSSDCR